MKESKVKEASTVTEEGSVKEEATVEAKTTEGREARLDKIAKHHILTSMGVGLVPFPVVDLVALMGIQLNMIRKVSAEYDIRFRQDLGKSIIMSLMGGVLPVTLGCVAASLIKLIPLIGQTTGAVTMPVVSGASTYAVYRVFVRHFETGGTFLTLDPSKVKTYFYEQFTKGKKVAADLKTEGTTPAAS